MAKVEQTSRKCDFLKKSLPISVWCEVVTIVSVIYYTFVVYKVILC